ncbi:hypothetical protein, partial [Cronobacter malonaticus]|uniref:hypothetical protein n=1 Tax=Cronobacter malonaticus TaxID=413503 RepID=UPI001E46686F
ELKSTQQLIQLIFAIKNTVNKTPIITNNIIMHPEGPFTLNLKGAPHFGQTSALLDTSPPHSLHLISAISPPPSDFERITGN